MLSNELIPTQYDDDDEVATADTDVDESDETAPVELANATIGEGAGSLRELVIFLVTNLVDDPETIDVDVDQRGGNVDLRLRVPESELGRVIGRQGRIARALRTALMVAASRHHLRVSLDIEPT